MKKGFNLSNLISFTISNHHHKNRHHINPRFFCSSSYNNNRSNDGYTGGRPPPPPRRRSDNTSSDRTPSSSRLSGYIENNDDTRIRGKRDFDTSRKPNFNNYNNSSVNNSINDSGKYRPRNREFQDSEQNPGFSRSRRVNDDSINKDADGFLDRFKLGFDEDDKNKLNLNKFNGRSRGNAGNVEGVAEETEQEMGPPEDADEIFRKMKETGLIPNAVSMLHGLCNDGLVQDAMKLFGVMRERGSIPEVVIYTAVVEGFCKSQKPDEAIRIFRKMQKNGVMPNAFSYGVLVQGLVKGKRLDDGFEFCLEMIEAGHSPNLVTFTGLVNVFCKERGLEAAQAMIGKLKEKGFGFDEKGVREFMDKKGPFSPIVWEAIFGKKGSQMF